MDLAFFDTVDVMVDFISPKEAIKAVIAIQEQHPDLSIDGFRLDEFSLRNIVGADQLVMRERDALFQFRCAYYFLRYACDRTSSTSSDALAARAEACLRDKLPRGCSVPNGMLIAAAFALGYEVKRIDRSLNAWIGASPKND